MFKHVSHETPDVTPCRTSPVLLLCFSYMSRAKRVMEHQVTPLRRRESDMVWIALAHIYYYC